MFTKTFTDPQGVTHTSAVFEISIANFTQNVTDSYDFRISEGDSENSQYSEESSSKDLNYQVYYWANQQARDEGKLPYILANTNPMGEFFYVSNDILKDPAYNGMSAKQMAEYHVQNVVLA